MMILPHIECGRFLMFTKFLLALLALLMPAIAQAADITGIAKVREGDTVQIGNSRIRLGGIDAPSVDQLCLNTHGERWTCGVAARDELAKHTEKKTWHCHVSPTPAADRSRVARSTAKTSRNGWCIAAGRWPMCASPTTTTPMRRPRARP